MKKMLSVVLVTAIALSLAACAATSGGEKMRVKCPACGYEFQAPASGGE